MYCSIWSGWRSTFQLREASETQSISLHRYRVVYACHPAGMNLPVSEYYYALLVFDLAAFDFRVVPNALGCDMFLGPERLD